MTGYSDPDYFEELYRRDPDPWKFATSEYERGKYAATMAALPPGRFERCFEVGCSIGVLTNALAERCNTVLAVDVALAALEQARIRCAAVEHVSFERMSVPGEWPDGQFDLILFSEVLYYLGIPGIHEAAQRTVKSLRPGGTVLLVNWRGPTDGACSGEKAAELFRSEMAAELHGVSLHRAEQYRIDVLKGGPAS